jgi:alcohol dehydrogenase (cytochrome c)
MRGHRARLLTRLLVSPIVLFTALRAGPAAAADQSPGVVDDVRLLGAPADTRNWLTFGRDYSNQRYSTLAQITGANVATLAPRWIYQTGVVGAFQATPLVVDGVMYVTTPYNHVVALDASTGAERWRYEHKLRTRALCCGPANRGPAVGYGKVFMATVDARLVALDQATGRPVWDVPLAAAAQGQSESREDLATGDPLRGAPVTGATGIGANMAPLVYRGKVLVGVTGVGYGLHLGGDGSGPIGAVIGVAGKSGGRGFFAAFDAERGTEVWRWYTVPEQGWEGEWRTQTADGVPLHRDIPGEQAAFAQHPDAWIAGGGSAWTTPAVDPDLGLLYLGVGNPSPQMDDSTRPGDNLYTVSLVALDVETGRLRWHHQQVPHDVWGYDVASPPLLFDLERDGRLIKAVAQAGKTGWLYVHDRATGALIFKSEPFVPQENLFAPPTRAGVRVAPGAAGGASWSPTAYNPRTGLIYVAAMHMPMRYTVRMKAAEGGRPAQRYVVTEPTDEPRWGTLTAIEARTGRIRWQRRLEQPLVGGVLATAGNLVFTGEGSGWFDAFDAETGDLRWRFQCGAGVNAPPITYEVAGTQYVAVVAGGNPIFGFRQGDALLTFALPR